MNPIIIGMIVLCIIAATVYITMYIWERVNVSEWQVIRYSGSSVEPKDIYICKRCNVKEDDNYHYCRNCGVKMKNGTSQIHYSDKIELSDDE